MSVSFEEFKKLELKVAEIKTVEDIPGADKLYKLTIDMGEPRTLVAGIKQNYPDKSELIGKKIAVVANLEPKKLKGVESHGMLLAASNQDRSLIVLLTVDKDIENGANIS